MNQRTYGTFLIVITALIWGSSMVAQSMGADHISPLTFNAARFYVGALVLLPVLLLTYRRGNRERGSIRAQLPQLLIGGLSCGSVIFLGVWAQQAGLAYTSAGKAGFICTLYVVIVPLFGMLAGKRVAPHIWACTLVALLGMYLLCIDETFSLSPGDAIVFLSAVGVAAHILLVGRFMTRVDGIALCFVQFLVCGTLSLVLAFMFERPSWQALASGIGPVLYTGVLSSGIGYSLQALGQKHVPPVLASLILSFESVISVLCGWIVLGEVLTIREGIGCTLMFLAIIGAQTLDFAVRKKRHAF